MSAQKKESTFDKEVESIPKLSKLNRASIAFYRRSVVVSIVLIVVLLIALGSGVYYYLQYKKTQQLLKNPTLGAQMETQNLLSKVGALMDLPKGEQPTIATVSDITKLKGQAFFSKAKNGDKVLIYPKAKKAILYDPVSNKIIEVQSVNIGSAEQNAPSPTVPANVPVNVVILNGTKTPGLATTAEKSLTEQNKYVTVVSKGNAKSSYTKTLVIDLTGKQASGASQIATTLNGEVGKLPTGEIKPANADILIILGGK